MSAHVEMPMPDCVLPGCRQPVIRIGEPCMACRAAFGDMLVHNPDGVSITGEEIEKRDNDTAAAMVLMQSITGRGIGHCIGDPDALPDFGDPGKQAEAECWSCNETVVCIWGSMGWECPVCYEEKV